MTENTEVATMSVEEAGRILGIGRGSAYRAARKGEIPTIRLGRRLLVPIPGLRALLGATSSDVIRAEPLDAA